MVVLLVAYAIILTTKTNGRLGFNTKFESHGRKGSMNGGIYMYI